MACLLLLFYNPLRNISCNLLDEKLILNPWLMGEKNLLLIPSLLFQEMFIIIMVFCWDAIFLSCIIAFDPKSVCLKQYCTCLAFKHRLTVTMAAHATTGSQYDIGTHGLIFCFAWLHNGNSSSETGYD